MGEITVRLDEKTEAQLQALSVATERAKSELAAEAILAYLEVQAWHKAEIEAGVREADAGDFLTDEEFAAAYKRWTS